MSSFRIYKILNSNALFFPKFEISKSKQNLKEVQKAKLEISSRGTTFIFGDFQVAMQIWEKLEEKEKEGHCYSAAVVPLLCLPAASPPCAVWPRLHGFSRADACVASWRRRW
jgi:hypothetical protein